MDLSAKIEALLFFRGEPTSIKKIADILDQSPSNVEKAVRELSNKLEDRGISLLEKDGEVTLGTSKEASSLIEKIIKEDLNKDLGRAGLETLSIILYLGPVARSRVDYIRGVSSTFILRNLLVRGLIERIDNPEDKRSFLYRPTFELLSYLGIKKIDELPEYSETRAELENKEKISKEREGSEIENG